MPTKRLLFGLWEPDSNEILGNGRASQAVNVVPVKGGYKAINGWGRATGDGGTAYSTNIFPSFGNNIIGAFAAKGPTGAAVDIISATSDVFMVEFASVTVTAMSSPPTAADTPLFRDITQYGDNIIMANGIGAGATSVAYYDLSSSTAWNAVKADFKARTITTMRDFVVVGYTKEGSTEYPNRVQWCGYGNILAWTPSAATQSDFQDMPAEFGRVQRVVGGNETFVVCEAGVAIMRYVGGATIMRFDYIHKNIGTAHPASCVRVGGYLYMFAKQGFVRLGMQEGDVAWIGSGRVDKEFRYNIELNSPYPRANGYHDQLNGGIGWQYTQTSGSAFFYSYIHDQWVVHGDTDSDDRDDAAFVYSSSISTLSGATYGTSSGVPTAVAVGLISGGGSYQLMAQNDQDNKARIVVSTGIEELTPARRSIVDKVYPLCELRDSGLTTPVLVVSSFPDSINATLHSDTSNGATASLQTGGFFTVTGKGSYEGKYHRFVLSNSRTAASRANEQEYMGVDVDYFARGKY